MAGPPWLGWAGVLAPFAIDVGQPSSRGSGNVTGPSGSNRLKYSRFGHATAKVLGLQGSGQAHALARTPMHRIFLLAAPLILAAAAAEAESGLASYYGGRGHGMTCAHRTRPFGSIVTVSYGGHSIRC